MCQGLVLLFDSTSYKQTHCTKLPGNQAASLLLNGTAVKYLLTFFVSALIVSLTFSEYMTSRNMSFSFYMLPSRLWELLFGGILAYQSRVLPQEVYRTALYRCYLR